MNVVCFRKPVAAMVFMVVVTVGFAGYGGDGTPSNNNGSGTPPEQLSCGGESARIGNLTWMTKNLNVSTADSWCYGNDASNCAKYGRLYTWDAARTACPPGWRLPTRQDWDNLVATVGDNAGTRLKARPPDWNGADNYCFSALPGGNRWDNGFFISVGDYGSWWTAAEHGSGEVYGRGMGSNISDVYEGWGGKSYGFSVRCVRD